MSGVIPIFLHFMYACAKGRVTVTNVSENAGIAKIGGGGKWGFVSSDHAKICSTFGFWGVKLILSMPVLFLQTLQPPVPHWGFGR